MPPPFAYVRTYTQHQPSPRRAGRKEIHRLCVYVCVRIPEGPPLRALSLFLRVTGVFFPVDARRCFFFISRGARAAREYRLPLFARFINRARTPAFDKEPFGLYFRVRPFARIVLFNARVCERVRMVFCPRFFDNKNNICIKSWGRWLLCLASAASVKTCLYR